MARDFHERIELGEGDPEPGIDLDSEIEDQEESIEAIQSLLKKRAEAEASASGAKAAVNDAFRQLGLSLDNENYQGDVRLDEVREFLVEELGVETTDQALDVLRSMITQGRKTGKDPLNALVYMVSRHKAFNG